MQLSEGCQLRGLSEGGYAPHPGRSRQHGLAVQSGRSTIFPKYSHKAGKGTVVDQLEYASGPVGGQYRLPPVVLEIQEVIPVTPIPGRRSLGHRPCTPRAEITRVLRKITL